MDWRRCSKPWVQNPVPQEKRHIMTKPFLPGLSFILRMLSPRNRKHWAVSYCYHWESQEYRSQHWILTQGIAKWMSQSSHILKPQVRCSQIHPKHSSKTLYLIHVHKKYCDICAHLTVVLVSKSSQLLDASTWISYHQPNAPWLYPNAPVSSKLNKLSLSS
jgi:hypothetical protein